MNLIHLILIKNLIALPLGATTFAQATSTLTPPPDNIIHVPGKMMDPEAYELEVNAKNCGDKNCKLWADFVLAGLWSRTDTEKACRR